MIPWGLGRKQCRVSPDVSDLAQELYGLLLLLIFRDTMESAKQSAALCLLRLYRTSPDLVPMGEWTMRVVHLLNDQHLVT